MAPFLKRIVCFIGLLSSLLYAQEDRAVLSLEFALQLGMNNNLTLQQQKYRIDQAMREIDIRRAGLVPRISAVGGYTYTSEEAIQPVPGTPYQLQASYVEVYNLGVTLQQPLFTGFRNHYLVKSSREEYLQTRSEEQITIHLIFHQIQQIFYAAQLNMLQQQVLQASLNRAGNDLQLTLNFFKAAQVSAFDTMKVANVRLNLQTQLNQLQHNQQVILTQLSYILNIPKVEAVTPLNPDQLQIIIASIDDYHQQALQNRPELQRIRYQLNAQTYRLKSVKSGYFPQINLQAGYYYAKPGVNIFDYEWADYYRIGLNFQWELWNRSRIRNQVRQTSSGTDLLMLEEQKILEQIKLEVRGAYENLLTDRDQIRLMKNLVAQEQERYRITRSKYQQGLATVLDLSDAESAWTAADLQLQQFYIKWLQDEAGMRYATGKTVQND